MHDSHEVAVFEYSQFFSSSPMFLMQCRHNLGISMNYISAAWRVFVVFG